MIDIIPLMVRFEDASLLFSSLNDKFEKHFIVYPYQIFSENFPSIKIGNFLKLINKEAEINDFDFISNYDYIKNNDLVNYVSKNYYENAKENKDSYFRTNKITIPLSELNMSTDMETLKSKLQWENEKDPEYLKYILLKEKNEQQTKYGIEFEIV